ncbi:MAG: DNA recombination protein RmuC, partial [Desulfomonilia bacterium]|nr:DNA recombination protein RmuC [Desulfomonilia bacterium]
PQVRGRWGEITLKRVVEISGMSSHCDFVEQPSTLSETGLKRPDMIVKLPQGRQVIIDAKVPLRSYMDAFESDDEEARNASFTRHAQAVRSHMISLASRDYWKQFDQSPDFVVLFLPGESFFSAALEHDQSLIEDGIARRVIISTPTTLIALLRTIAAVWQQNLISENAREVWETGLELYERVSVMVRHLAKIGEGILKTTQAYNAALGSWETRVQPSAHRLKGLVSPLQGKELPIPVPVDLSPRGTPPVTDDQEEGTP